MKQAFSRNLAALLALALSSAAIPAAAQYVWINESGNKQYSDRPPPQSVPSSRILKLPRGMRQPDSEATSSKVATEASAAALASAPAADRKPLTVADQEADFRKRRVEQAEKAKKAADEARLAAEKTRNCERARAYRATLESGQRIARPDASGERGFMSEEERTSELRDTQQLLKNCN